MAIAAGRQFVTGSPEPAQALPAGAARLQAAALPEQVRPPGQALPEEARLPQAASSELPERRQASQPAA